MKLDRLSRLVLVPGLLLLLAGCDLVEWGGTEVEVVPPPDFATRDMPEEEIRRAGDVDLPRGTVLFHLRREGERARISPIGELSGDTLRMLRRPADVSPDAYERRFRDAVYGGDGEFTLFHRGARVGAFEFRRTGEPNRCGVPTGEGVINTVAAAADVEEFLAFRRGLVPDGVPTAEYAAPEVTGRINRYASLVAERLILQAGLPRPRSWAGAQKDVQALDVSGQEVADMAATYLVGDELRVGPADPRGYSVLYLASWDAARGYTPFYVRTHNYAAEESKAAPRLLDHLSWTGDGRPSVLLQVFGTDGQWFELIRPGEGGDWRQVWRGSTC